MICYCGFRCGPCRMMTPVFARLSVKYSAAVFLKVDVDQCQVRLLHSRGTQNNLFLFTVKCAKS